MWVPQPAQHHMSSAQEQGGFSRQIGSGHVIEDPWRLTTPAAALAATATAPTCSQSLGSRAVEGSDAHTLRAVQIPRARWWGHDTHPEDVTRAGRQPEHEGLSQHTGTETGVGQPEEHAAADGDSFGLSASPLARFLNSEDNLALTRSIKQCRTWRQLQELYRHTAPRFNIIHVSALLVTLRRVVPSALFPKSSSPRHSDGGDSGIGEGLLDTLSAHSQSSGLGRRAMRERREVLAFAQQVLGDSLALLPHFGAYELTACLHMLSKSGVTPPKAWVRAALQCAYPLVRSGNNPS